MCEGFVAGCGHNAKSHFWEKEDCLSEIVHGLASMKRQQILCRVKLLSRTVSHVVLRMVLENARNHSLIGQGEQHLLCNKGFYQKDATEMFRFMLSCSIAAGRSPAPLWMTTTMAIYGNSDEHDAADGYGCHDDKAEANDPCHGEHTAGGAARHGLPGRQSISSKSIL